MSSKIAKLTTLCLACLALIVIPFETLQAAETSQAQKKPFRVLVDASKDGGLWWFPQGEGGIFDPRQPHQGKPLADLLRRQQWEVVELPRGDVITAEKLRDFDLIIKPPAYFSYTADEAMAYLNSIVAGACCCLAVEMRRTTTPSRKCLVCVLNHAADLVLSNNGCRTR